MTAKKRKTKTRSLTGDAAIVAGQPRSIRLSDAAAEQARRIRDEIGSPGLKASLNSVINHVLEMSAKNPRCPECTTPLEPIVLTEDGSETGFWRCPECSSGENAAAGRLFIR